MAENRLRFEFVKEDPREEPLSGKPFVSIVIPCYNQGPYLGEAIQSALNQTYPNLQVIVVDDGSTDSTAQVAAGHLCVQVIRQSNQGLAAARNTGLRNCQGRYVSFLDADDRLLPNAIETGAGYLDDHPEAAFVSGYFRYIQGDGSILNEFNQEPASPDPFAAFLKGNYIGMHATVLYRREVLAAEGGFNPDLPCCEDYDLYLRIARKFPVSRHCALVAEYRQHEQNMSSNSQLMLKTVISVLHSQEGYIQSNEAYRQAYREGLKSWKEYYGEKLAMQAAQRWTSGEKGQALKTAWAGTRMAPRQFAYFAAGLLKEKSVNVIKALLPTQIVRRLGNRRPGSQIPVGQVIFGDFRSLEPLSREYGFDRGLPIDRYYIEKFLAGHAGDIRGRVLEVGDDSYTRKYGGERVSFCDVLHISPGNPKATIVADLACADHIPSNTFDCIVLTQTLHLIYEVRSALQTLQRILKPGGVMLATFPGISQISIDEWADSWYWSFTVSAARQMFEEFFPPEKIEIQAHGNVLTSISFLYGLACQELKPEELDYHDPKYPMLITLRAVKPDE